MIEGLIYLKNQKYIKAIYFFERSILAKKQNYKSYFYKGTRFFICFRKCTKRYREIWWSNKDVWSSSLN